MAASQRPLNDIVCNASMLEQLLIVDGGAANMTDLQSQLCDLPPDVLQEAERLFFSQLDLSKFLAVGVLLDVLRSKLKTRGD